jgi:thioredoxin-like negative regulator of GroEL
LVEAIPLFEALWNQYSDESRFGIKLFESQLALGRPTEARQALEKLVREKQRYALEAQEELKRLSEEWKGKKPEKS